MVKRKTAENVLAIQPVPNETQLIARVVETLGQSQFKVLTTTEELLASLPPKFQKTVWIKKGSFVIIELYQSTTKIEAEIVHILFKDDIKNLKQKKLWPNELELGLEESEEIDDMFVNRNRQVSSDSEGESI
jgi:probable RNA-binding protein EIF1AD